MAYRGRLIFPRQVSLFRQDAEGMHADPDGAGPLTSGLDPIFLEPIVKANAARTGSKLRLELDAVMLPAQVEIGRFHRSNMAAGGNRRASDVTCVFHFDDLEAQGLVETLTGTPRIKIGDRIGGVYRLDGGLIQIFADPPGLFVTETQPRFGFQGDRSLLVVSCAYRERG